MALNGNAFSGQTVTTTSQAASCLTICDGSKELLPDMFYFVLLDVLARKLNIDVSTISSADLSQVINNAYCATSSHRLRPTISDRKAQQLILFLANQLFAI